MKRIALLAGLFLTFAHIQIMADVVSTSIGEWFDSQIYTKIVNGNNQVASIKLFTEGNFRKIQLKNVIGEYNTYLLEAATSDGTQFYTPEKSNLNNLVSFQLISNSESISNGKNNCINVPGSNLKYFVHDFSNINLTSSQIYRIINYGVDISSSIEIPCFNDTFSHQYNLILCKVENNNIKKIRILTIEARIGYFSGEVSLFDSLTNENVLGACHQLSGKDYLSCVLSFIYSFDSGNEIFYNELKNISSKNNILEDFSVRAKSLTNYSDKKMGLTNSYLSLMNKSNLNRRMGEFYSGKITNLVNTGTGSSFSLPVVDERAVNLSIDYTSKYINLQNAYGIYGKIYAELCYAEQKPFYSEFASQFTGGNFKKIQYFAWNGGSDSEFIAKRALWYLSGGIHINNFEKAWQKYKSKLFKSSPSYTANTSGKSFLNPYVSSEINSQLPNYIPRAIHRITVYSFPKQPSQLVAFENVDYSNNADFDLYRSNDSLYKELSNKNLELNEISKDIYLSIKPRSGTASIQSIVLLTNNVPTINSIKIYQKQVDQFGNDIGLTEIGGNVFQALSPSLYSFPLKTSQVAVPNIIVKIGNTEKFSFGKCFIFGVSNPKLINDSAYLSILPDTYTEFQKKCISKYFPNIINNNKFGDISDTAVLSILPYLQNDAIKLQTTKISNSYLPKNFLNVISSPLLTWKHTEYYQSILITENNSESGVETVYFYDSNGISINATMESYNSDLAILTDGNLNIGYEYFDNDNYQNYTGVTDALKYAKSGIDIPLTYNYKLLKHYEFSDESQKYRMNSFRKMLDSNISEVDLLNLLNIKNSLNGGFNYSNNINRTDEAKYLQKRAGYPYKIGYRPTVSNEYMINSPFVASKVAGCDSLGMLTGLIFQSHYTEEYSILDKGKLCQIPQMAIGTVIPKPSSTVNGITKISDIVKQYYDFQFQSIAYGNYSNKEFKSSTGETDYLAKYMTACGSLDKDYVNSLSDIRINQFDIEASSVIVPNLDEMQVGDIVTGAEGGDYKIGLVVEFKRNSNRAMSDVIVLSTDAVSGQAYLATWGNNTNSFGGFSTEPENFVARRMGTPISDISTKNWEYLSVPSQGFALHFDYIDQQSSLRITNEQSTDLDPQFSSIDSYGEPFYLGHIKLSEKLIDGDSRPLSMAKKTIVENFLGSGVDLLFKAPKVTAISPTKNHLSLYFIVGDQPFMLPTYNYAHPNLGTWNGTDTTFKYTYSNLNLTGSPGRAINMLVLAKYDVTINANGTMSMSTTLPSGVISNGTTFVLKYDDKLDSFYYESNKIKYYDFGYMCIAQQPLAIVDDHGYPEPICTITPQVEIAGTNAMNSSVSADDLEQYELLLTQKHNLPGIDDRPDITRFINFYVSNVSQLFAADAKKIKSNISTFYYDSAAKIVNEAPYFSRSLVHIRLNNVISKIKDSDYSKTLLELAPLINNSYSSVTMHLTNGGISTFSPIEVFLTDIRCLIDQKFDNEISLIKNSESERVLILPGIFSEYYSSQNAEDYSFLLYAEKQNVSLLMTACLFDLTGSDFVSQYLESQRDAFNKMMIDLVFLQYIGNISKDFVDGIRYEDYGKSVNASFDMALSVAPMSFYERSLARAGAAITKVKGSVKVWVTNVGDFSRAAKSLANAQLNEFRFSNALAPLQKRIDTAIPSVNATKVVVDDVIQKVDDVEISIPTKTYTYAYTESECYNAVDKELRNLTGSGISDIVSQDSFEKNLVNNLETKVNVTGDQAGKALFEYLRDNFTESGISQDMASAVVDALPKIIKQLQKKGITDLQILFRPRAAFAHCYDMLGVLVKKMGLDNQFKIPLQKEISGLKDSGLRLVHDKAGNVCHVRSSDWDLAAINVRDASGNWRKLYTKDENDLEIFEIVKKEINRAYFRRGSRTIIIDHPDQYSGVKQYFEIANAISADVNKEQYIKNILKANGKFGGAKRVFDDKVESTFCFQSLDQSISVFKSTEDYMKEFRL